MQGIQKEREPCLGKKQLIRLTSVTWPSSTELEKAWDLGYKAGFSVFKREGCQSYNRKMGSLIDVFIAYWHSIAFRESNNLVSILGDPGAVNRVGKNGAPLPAGSPSILSHLLV